MVLIERDVYVNHMENILKGNTKFEKVDREKGFQSFRSIMKNMLMKF